VQQLSALHYAWGGMDTDPSSGYAKNFENSKETFLKTVKNGSALQEAKKVLITQIRAQICEQLPAELSMRLNAMYQSCQEKLSTDQSFGYTEMKAEMLRLISTLLKKTEEPTPEFKTFATTATPPNSKSSSTNSTIVSPPSREDAVQIAISPLKAPQQLAFLDSFPVEWRSRPAWPHVIASMEKYLRSYSSYQGQAQKDLLLSHPDSVWKAVESIQLHTALPAEEASRVAYQREIVNIAMDTPFKAENEEILGCKTSRMMESTIAQEPGNQLSLSMRVPMCTGAGKVCRPIVLSVSAPALDTAQQPEWNHYVKDGKFDVQAYRIAFDTIARHISECARMPANKGAQVVLSGFGLANFLANLPGSDREKATAVGAEVMTKLITDLQADGIEVAYTDHSGSSTPWPQVNAALGKAGIKCLGSIPGGWITDQKIIVNAWDPHALVGNGCVQDRSLDGYIGRNSLVHEAHALACILHANGYTV
jgi:hypothetical protein